jgi:hypothetical protein
MEPSKGVCISRVNRSLDTLCSSGTDYIDHLTKQAMNGCSVIRLRPGYYEVIANYYQGKCSPTLEGAHCSDGRYPFEIQADEVIEMEFDLVKLP